MTNRKTDPVERESTNPLDERMEHLKKLFPEAVNEDGIDIDTLVNLLGKKERRKERYNFTWAGKQDAILSLQKRSKATLKPVPEESVNWDDTGHLFIEGDNLEVMKLLYKSYFGQVKMIYIDPPYNTGNDFIYPDNYSDPLNHYLHITGQADEKGNVQTTNTDTSGRKHSSWLSMMYPRLFIARQLLRDDGVLFVSIDDTEVHNLRNVLNEIFGQENFVSIFVWNKRTAKSDVPFGVSQDYEWIVCYAKSAEFLAGIKHERKYYYTEDIPNDGWRLSDLTTQRTAEERENSAFDMVDPKTGKKYPYNPKRVWGVTKTTFQQYYDKGKIVFPDDYEFLNISRPAFRVFESEDKAKAFKKYGTDNPMKAVSTKLPDTVGMTEGGNKEIIELFGERVFPYSKPPSLIQYLISVSTGDDDIVLDFFAGSSATAQAVFQQNYEDDANRKFIMVQLPEILDKNKSEQKIAYNFCMVNGLTPTIAEISKDRIRRVVKRILQNQKAEENLGQDVGFRVFKLDTSPMRQWEELPADQTSPDDYTQQMELFINDPLLEGWTVEDVIAEVAIKEAGFSLTYRVESVDAVTDQAVYIVIDEEKEQHFYICLDEKISLEALKPLDLARDDLFIFRDSAIDDTIIANLALTCRIKSI